MTLVATAGLDLFREGLLMDAVDPPPCYPATSAHLDSIPESSNNPMVLQATTDSQVILILGNALDGRGKVAPLGTACISKAADLYWDSMEVYAQHQVDAFCYFVPTGGENDQGGIIQTEAMRNELVEVGISPHHIIMDCCATSMIDNVVQLIPALRHLHIERVHVVASGFEIPRAKVIVTSILNAVPDMKFTITYHAAFDVLSKDERIKYEALERRRMKNVHEMLDNVLNEMKQQRHSSITSMHDTNNSNSGSRNEYSYV